MTANIVEVVFYGWQTQIRGNPSAPLALQKELPANATLQTLLDQLQAEYPDLRKAMFDDRLNRPHDHVVVLVNDNFVDNAQCANTKLHPGDRIKLMPFLAGG